MFFYMRLIPTKTFLANLNLFNQQARGGPSEQAVISGDGSTIAYKSKATQFSLCGKGIALIEVKNGGVGYLGNPTLLVTDLNGNWDWSNLGICTRLH